MQFDFLICSERSGSNLITRLMHAHSRICAPSTTHLFRVLADGLAGYGDLQRDDAWEVFVADACELIRTTLGPWHADEADWLHRVHAAAHPRSWGGLLRTIYECETIASGKFQVFIKEIELFRFQSLLDAEFPTARYVYLVRDPRDMALSWKRSAAIRGGVVRAAQVWQRDQAAYLPWVESLTRQGRVVPLTYEQLISNTPECLSRVCALLDVDYEPNQLSFHDLSDTRGVAHAAADFANLQRPVMEHNAQKFLSGLSEDEITYVEGRCGPLMKQLGYQPMNSQRSGWETLEAALLPLEPQQKLAYEQVSDRERELRARWVAVTQRIRQREGVNR